MDGGTQIQSVFPNVPAPIHAVQGGGGHSTTWKMIPIEVSQTTKAPEINVSPGNLKKYKLKWKRSLGPNIPSRRKPRGDPHILVGTLNVLECPVFIAAPLRGNKDAAAHVLNWAKDKLESDSKAHVVFMGPLGSGKEGTFIEKHVEALQVNYPGHALYISKGEGSLYALDGLRITGIPNTSKQIGLGFIPDSQNIYHSSSRTLDCLKLDTLRIPANSRDSDDSPSIHLLEFDKPSREYDSEKKSPSKTITESRTLNAPPGWVAEIAFSHMKGGDGNVPADATVPAVVPAAVPTPSNTRAAAVKAAREKLEAAKAAKETASAKVTSTASARIAAIKAAREASAQGREAAKAAEEKAKADEEKAIADEAAAKAAEEKAAELLKSADPLSDTETIPANTPANTPPANTPNPPANSPPANSPPANTPEDSEEPSEGPESKLTVTFGENKYVIGDPKSPGVLKRWQKGDYNKNETKLLDEGGLKYESKIYALFLQGLAEHSCDTESETMTNPACKVYRFIMARQYEDKIKSKNLGPTKRYTPSNTSGNNNTSSKVTFVPDPELMKKPVISNVITPWKTSRAGPGSREHEPVRSHGRVSRSRSPPRVGSVALPHAVSSFHNPLSDPSKYNTEPVESSGRAPRSRSPPRFGSVTGEAQGIKPSHKYVAPSIEPSSLNIEKANEFAKIVSSESAIAVEAAAKADAAMRNAINAAANLGSTNFKSNPNQPAEVHLEVSPANLETVNASVKVASEQSAIAINAAAKADAAMRNAQQAAANLSSTNFKSNPIQANGVSVEATPANLETVNASVKLASDQSAIAVKAANQTEAAMRNAQQAAANLSSTNFRSNPNQPANVHLEVSPANLETVNASVKIASEQSAIAIQAAAKADAAMRNAQQAAAEMNASGFQSNPNQPAEVSVEVSPANLETVNASVKLASEQSAISIQAAAKAEAAMRNAQQAAAEMNASGFQSNPVQRMDSRNIEATPANLEAVNASAKLASQQSAIAIQAAAKAEAAMRNARQAAAEMNASGPGTGPGPGPGPGPRNIEATPVNLDITNAPVNLARQDYTIPQAQQPVANLTVPNNPFNMFNNNAPVPGAVAAPVPGAVATPVRGGTRRKHRNPKNKSPKKRRAKKSIKKRVSKSKTYRKRK